MQKLPRLLHFLINLLLINLALFSLFRLAFWIYFKTPADLIPTEMLVNSFYLGFKYDLRLVLLMILPLFLLGGLRLLSPFESRLMRHLWFIYLTLAFFIVLQFYYLNFGYYAYLQQPMNATILRFAYNFGTSMQMVSESYPIVWITLSMLVLLGGYLGLMHWLLRRAADYANPFFHGWRKTIVISLSSLLLILGVYGKASWYPLRWSDAFSNAHHFAPAVTLNPVLYFFNTLKNKNIRVDENKVRQHYALISEFLGVDKPDETHLNFQRVISQPGTYAKQRPNVVMVFLESFASYKTGAFGNPLNPTPNFDKLAKQSLQYSRYYSPHTGTARSVFAAITGIPDIELNKTSSRNPLVVDQHTIVNAFKDYKKLYFLGGSANWGNIRGVLQHNIEGLEVHEEGDFSSPRIDVWGISDLDLFKEANQVLTKQTQPFFAIIQTSGNHRPYTIPEDSHGFKLMHQNREVLEKAGFISNGEYNAFRFMDHSLGYFMQQAKEAGYLDNTLFIFYGDHGITGYGGTHSPEFENPYILTGLHTPLIFYAPSLITQPQMDTKPASELDLLPTIASLAAPSYTNTTLGRDLRDPRFAKQRYAFTITHHSISEIGLIGEDYYFRMSEDGSNKILVDTRSTNPEKNVLTVYPEVAAQMEALTVGIHETAKYMLYHNPRQQTQK
ncbi:Sulfatase family protein [hydrothermal vent metagenome]|uniref:Sulfatase family protein n=1 Tax=hydrothermal vent metagenome TaxID=652676 RepID=A0A3B1B1P6_9ZZZZ